MYIVEWWLMPEGFVINGTSLHHSTKYFSCCCCHHGRLHTRFNRCYLCADYSMSNWRGNCVPRKNCRPSKGRGVPLFLYSLGVSNLTVLIHRNRRSSGGNLILASSLSSRWSGVAIRKYSNSPICVDILTANYTFFLECFSLINRIEFGVKVQNSWCRISTCISLLGVLTRTTYSTIK